MSQNINAKAVGLLLALSLIWGTSFILIKQGLKVFPPDVVASLRVSAAFFFLLPFALVRLKELKRSDYPLLLVSGLLGVFIPAFLFAIAQTRITSSLAGILNTLSPIFVMIVGSAFFGQRFRILAVVGTMIGIGGTIVLMLARSGGAITGINFYTLLIVAACVMYGTNLNWVKFKIHSLSSLTITSVSLMLIGPAALIHLLLLTDFLPTLQQTDGAWTACGLVVLLGCMSTALAMFLFNELVKITTPLFASSVTYLMPIVSVLWGVWDKEPLFAGHFVGMAAILGGVYLVNKK